MSETPNVPKPGWYPDPTGSDKLRWWDGEKWTQRVQDAPPEPSAEPAAAAPVAAPVTANAQLKPAKEKKPWYQRPLPLVGVGFLALLVIAAIAGGGDEDKNNKSATAETTTSSASTTQQETTTEEATTTTTTTEAKPKPDGCGVKATDDCTPEAGPKGVVQVDTLRWRVKKAVYTSSLGDQQYGLGAKADGVFVVLTLSVKNGKDESVTLTSDVAQLDIGGKTYDVDNDGTVAAIGSGQDPFFLEDVGPDVTTVGKAVFDIPKSAIDKKIQVRFNELGFGSTHAFIAVNPVPAG